MYKAPYSDSELRFLTMKCFCASVCVLLSFGFVCGQAPCVTPKGDNGDCRSILECPQLRTVANKPSLAPDEAALLRRSACGYTDNIPKVCCPTTKEPPPLIKTCVTPDGSQGECVSVFDCAHVVKRLQSATVTAEDKAYVNSIRCQTPKGGFSVCCGSPNPSTTPPDSPSTGVSAPSDPHAECGKDASSGSKLLGVGGHATLIDEYPWLAIVERRNRENRNSLVCGGALISARYVLTAAHCVTGVAGPPSTVRLGEYDTSHPGRDCVKEIGGEDCSEEPVVIPIELVVPHLGYDARSKRHDIALLRLSQHAPYTDFIRPICLPTTDVAEFRGREWLVMAGWGANETHSTSSVKLAVDLPYKSIEECQLAYNGPRRRASLWRGQLCAGGEPGRDSCKGDSGGPLMYFSSRRVFEVVGIVSFGATTCGLEHVPGVYTKVFEYLAWIKSNMKP